MGSEADPLTLIRECSVIFTSLHCTQAVWQLFNVTDICFPELNLHIGLMVMHPRTDIANMQH